jgi:ketosteroid isomerase-like protein
MVKRRTILLAVGILIAAAVFLLVRMRTDRDEREIRGNLAELVKLSRLEKREDALKAGLRSRGIAGHFTDDAVVSVPSYQLSIHGRQEIQAMVFQLRTQADRFSLQLGGVEIDLAGDRARAGLSCSAHARVGRGRESEDARGDLEMEWARTEEGWQIKRVETVETIRRPL